MERLVIKLVISIQTDTLFVTIFVNINTYTLKLFPQRQFSNHLPIFLMRTFYVFTGFNMFIEVLKK